MDGLFGGTNQYLPIVRTVEVLSTSKGGFQQRCFPQHSNIFYLSKVKYTSAIAIMQTKRIKDNNQREQNLYFIWVLLSSIFQCVRFDSDIRIAPETRLAPAATSEIMNSEIYIFCICLQMVVKTFIFGQSHGRHPQGKVLASRIVIINLTERIYIYAKRICRVGFLYVYYCLQRVV